MPYEKPTMTIRPEQPVLPKENQCNHSYKLLDHSMDTYYADGSPYTVSIMAAFFCDKCLDIQQRHKQEPISIEVKN